MTIDYTRPQQSPAPPQGGWWSRNWKWFVPVGCLAMAMFTALFFGAVVFGAFGMMKRSDVYREAVARAHASPAVVAALGTPIEEGRMVSGSIQQAGPGGTAQLEIPLSGPKGDGKLYLDAKRSLGKWEFNALVLETPAGSRVDLLQETPPHDAGAR